MNNTPENKFRFQEVARNPLPNFPNAEPLLLEDIDKDPWWRRTYESVFSAPIGLGENLAELFPEVKEARAEVARLRAKGLTEIADEMERTLGEKPTTAQVIGNAAGTALWVVPIPLAHGLKAAPAAQAFIRGGLYGAAFGAADAMGEGKNIDDVMTRAITGGMIGAPVGLAGYGVFKYGMKIPKKVAQAFKTPETVKKLLYPTMTRLRDLGKKGVAIAEGFKNISIEAQRKAGETMLKFGKVGIVKNPRLFPTLQKKVAKLLSRDAAWRGENSLLDVLSGKTSPKATSAQVGAAGKVGRKVLDEIADSADDIGILVGKRHKYIPHLTPSAKVVALNNKQRVALQKAKTIAEKEAIYLANPLRKDVIENAVFKEKAFKSISTAGQVLDSWTVYVQRGRRIIDEKVRPFLDYLIKTGQAKSLKEAEAKAYRTFLHRPLRRIARYGPLEFSREINFPFWDPDPRRFLPAYTIDAITRMETAITFGPENQILNRMIKTIGQTKGIQTAREVDNLVRTITGQIRRQPARHQVSFALRMIQTPKLAYAQILNIGQNLNTLLASDVGSLAYGLQSAFTDKGVQNALKSGAILQSLMRKQLSYIGGSGFGERILKYTGFTWTELFNRTVAANAGMKYAQKTFAKLKANPTNKFLRWRLEELGISPDTALNRGNLIERELLRAGNLMSSKTQFLSEPLYLPAWASSPEGKVVFQFKNFAFNQALFVKRQLLSPQVPLTRKIRTLAILSLVYPMSGEVLGDIRSLLTGVKRPTKAWDRYWSNIAMAGTWGLAMDFWEAARFRRVAEQIGGPTVGSVAELSENFVASVEAGEPTSGFIKSVLRQTGVLRPIGNWLYPTRRKNMGDVFEFWEDL